MTLFMPKGASEAGNRKIPAPIMLPTTSAAHIHIPSLRSTLIAFSGSEALLPRNGFATLDHAGDFRHAVDVGERVAGEGYHVAVLAHGDRADVLFLTQQLRGVDRRRLDG